MKLFKWTGGRRKGGLKKFPILMLSWPIKIDAYLVEFPTDSYIDPHIDTCDGYNHYRLNITLQRPVDGGKFICQNCIINFWRIVLFRPDLYVHSLTKVTAGRVLLISFGIAV